MKQRANILALQKQTESVTFAWLKLIKAMMATLIYFSKLPDQNNYSVEVHPMIITNLLDQHLLLSV